MEVEHTEVKGKLRVVVSLPVGDEVDLVLPPLLLETLLGAPVVAHTAARQDDDQGPHQPEPCRQATTTQLHLQLHRQRQTSDLVEGGTGYGSGAICGPFLEEKVLFRCLYRISVRSISD